MEVISESDYEDIPRLAIRVITKEVMQIPPFVETSLRQRLSGEVHLYGYLLQSFYHNFKHYVLAIRMFACPQIKLIPSAPQMHVRQEAEKFELQRQQMGYVTELELELAKECIKTMTLEVDNTKEQSELKALQSLYGLLWLGYDAAYTIGSRFPSRSSVRKLKCEEYRLHQLKEKRFAIVEEEEYTRLKRKVQKNRSEPARYVKDYLQAEAAKQRLGNRNPSFFGKLFSCFRPTEQIDSTEIDQDGTIIRQSQEEKLEKQNVHSTPALQPKKKRM